MKRTSSRDLSIDINAEKLFVEVRRQGGCTRKGLVGWLVRGVNESERRGASTRLAVLFSFVCTASELEIILAASQWHRFVLVLSIQDTGFLPVLCSASCLGLVVAAVVEVSVVDLASEEIIHLQWASHLLIYKPCQESRVPSIPYVLVLF